MFFEFGEPISDLVKVGLIEVITDFCFSCKDKVLILAQELIAFLVGNPISKIVATM